MSDETEDEILKAACDEATVLLKGRSEFCAWTQKLVDDYINKSAREHHENRTRAIVRLEKSADPGYLELRSAALEARRERDGVFDEVQSRITKRHRDTMDAIAEKQAAMVEDLVVRGMSKAAATEHLAANSTVFKALTAAAFDAQHAITNAGIAIGALIDKAAQPQPAPEVVPTAVDTRTEAHRALDAVIAEYAARNNVSIATAFTSCVGPGGDPHATALYRQVRDERNGTAPPMSQPA